MIKEIIESNLPNYATLSSATITLNDMGDRIISTQMKILGSIVPSFSYNGEAWAVTYNGEKFILTVRDPEASKSIDGSSSTISLNFESEFCYELKRYLFFEAASTYAGTIVADKYKASLKLSISDFVTNFNQVLGYYFGAGVFSIRLAQGVSFSSTPALFDIDHIYIWDVLQKIYEIYNVRWGMSFSVVGGVTQYVITIGEAVSALDHVFEYGYAGGLTKCERQIQESNIRNILLGRGGDKNLPMYYFKDVPEGSPYTPDPDRCPELDNENAPINITQLHGKTFRDYIQGWNYGKNYSNARPEPLNPSVAWSQGYTDATTGANFNPVEYVKDQDSIDKYGELWSGLDDNEDIYPSIQGVKMPSPDYSDANAVVAVEQVTNDDIEEAVAKSVVITDLPAAVQATCTGTWRREEPAIPLAYMYCEVWSREFTVPEGQTANITYDTAIYVSDLVTWNHNGLTGVKEMDKSIHTYYNPIIHTSTDAVNPSYFILQHAGTGYYYSDGEGHPIHNPSAIPAGSYRLIVHVGFTPTFPDGEKPHITFTSEISNIQITSAAISVWKPSFDIWIKNIWGTTKGQSESYSAYTSRVWNPILGDLSEGTKQISFVDGALSSSSDWDFKILGVEYNTDDTKIYEDASHNTHKAEWKLTLEKSQAEKETDNKFIPRENTNASAGDHIMVLGIQLPQVLVEAAEERLDLWKTEQLNSTKDIEPTWAITLDKVRINTLEGDETVLLSSLVDAGVKIQLRDIRFSSGIKELYIQSLEKTWNDETVMNPEINVVLADKVIPVSNPVSKIKAEVKTIQSQYVAIQDVEAAVRRVGSLQFLNKTGSEDTSMSPTKFSNVVQSSDFRQGDIGGMGWGFYKDKQGNSIFEADTIIARNNLITNEIISNIATYVGGLQIYSAASIVCTNIVEDVSGYSCYFDNKLGSLANLFQVRDIAYSHTFDSSNSTISFYKREVIEVGLDYVKLSKTSFAEGSSAPAIGDTIIHYGNFNDSNRQFVIVRDVVNGGYERMISNLNGYNAGAEYYYAGAVLSGSEVQKRWFVGDTSNYAKYEKVGDSYALTIKGNVFVGDTDISSWAYLAESLGSKNGGLVLANKLAVYNGTDAQATVQGGINGVYIDSNSIAAWFGGDMKDRAVSQDLDAASILFRFGGSGYVAKNNLSWDENGVVTLNPDQIYVSSGLKMSEVNQIASIIGLKPVDNISTAFIKEGRPFLVENNITATGIVRGDAGVFAGGIADLYEYGTAGYNSFDITGDGNAITDVIDNVSSLTFVRGATFSLDGHHHISTEIDDLSTDVIPEGTAKFIYYPDLPLGRFKRDDGSWADVTAGGGSSAANVYLTNNNSDVSGYKTASSINDAATSTFTYTQSGVGEHLLATFLYGVGIGTTVLDAGSWSFYHHSKASTTAGNPYLRFEIFKRSTAGVETTLFTKSSFVLTTVYEQRTTTDWQPSFSVLATDRLGVRIYVVSGVAASVTFNLQVGDSTVSYVNTPLALRHTQLRGLNDDTGFLHITSTEKSHYETAYSHTSLTNNPHGVTKSQVGLGNVDNTSDINKPVSTAQQATIDAKLDATQSGSIICNSIPVAPEAAYEVSNITFSSAASVTRCHYVIKFVHKIPTGVEAGFVTLKIGTFINNVYYRGSAASTTNSWDDNEWCDCFYDNGLWRCSPTEATMSYQVWDSTKEIIKDNRIL